jgi:hypothetical protein
MGLRGWRRTAEAADYRRALPVTDPDGIRRKCSGLLSANVGIIPGLVANAIEPVIEVGRHAISGHDDRTRGRGQTGMA